MQSYLFGGFTVTRKISDLALGYKNPVTEKWNTDVLANNT
jgi:hypothetical protein